MQWYYAGATTPEGPIDEAQLDSLVRTGALKPETLVWQQGMPNWQPYHAVRGGLAPPVLPDAMPAAPGTTACAECGATFAQGEMVSLGGSWVCARCKPVFLQRLREGVPRWSAGQMFRDGRNLVLRLGGQLPPRCVKCNAPVSRPPIKRTLYWHQQWIYLLILISILIYAIVALIVRKKAVVHVPVCDEHRRQRGLFIAGSWLAVLVGIGMVVVAFGQEGGWWALGGVVLLVAGIVVGIAKGTLVSARRIDDQFVHFRGCNPRFLEGLPEWTGPNA